jgi:hypothetical protein
MKITASQRITIMKLYQQVCKERGWKAGDRDFRLAKFSELIGRQLASSDDIGRIDECTKLMNELKSLLGVSVQAGLEADDLTINQGRVLRHQILTELIPCLELYIHDVPAYLTSIMEDKNRWWKIDRPIRDITLMDLDTKPIIRRDRKTGELVEFPSPLKQMLFTLSARLNVKRNEAGDTIHEMKIRAGIPCACSKCVSSTNHVALVAQPF